jgi:mannose-6-phosphate isomerase-like protein (cupin superfamily)
MLVKKSERKKQANSPVCVIYEYGHGDKDVNIVVVELSGRYPTKGRVINKICKEVTLVIEGKGKVGIDDKEFSLEEGDSILIKPNQKFFWEGKMKLVMVCNPAFKPEQHVECD